MRNTEKLDRLVRWMKARNYSDSTINNYKHHLELFFNFVGDDSARISEKTIQDYILQIPNNFSFSYKNQAINSIKLYFEVVEKRFFNNTILPRPKGQQFIPTVLSQDEIERLIFNTKNLKHKTILFTIYDNGLRVSEFCNLTLMDLRTKCETPHLIIRDTKNHRNRFLQRINEG